MYYIFNFFQILSINLLEEALIVGNKQIKAQNVLFWGNLKFITPKKKNEGFGNFFYQKSLF